MFYGWWIVASVFTAQLFVVGFFTYAYPFVVVPVKEEFQASTTEINFAMMASSMVALVLPPLIGPLADRWSARKLMMIGASMLAVALWALSLTQGIAQFVAVFALLIAGANVLLGPITGQAIVSRWFTTTRGRALGITATGTSIGGLVLPGLVTEWMELWGWRGSLQALGVAVAVCTIPLLVLALRDHPADKGLEPEGSNDPEALAAMQAGADGRVWTTLEIVKSRPYWLIGICLGLLFMAYTALLSNLGLYVDGVGLDASSGRTLVWLIALCGLIGKITLGAASDRIGLRLGLWIALGLAACGIGILSTEPAYPAMIAAACLLGLAAGGMLPVWAGMIAAAFGTASFGRAMGLVSPVIGVLVMPGFMIAGWSADTTGSYAPALRIFVGQILVASVLLFALDLGQRKPAEAT